MRWIKCLLVLSFVVFCLALCACSSGGVSYKDGTYFAEADEFADSGWKETVEITIEDGNLIKVDWDAVYVDDSIPIKKKQYSKSGLYGMLQAGAVGEWYDQATAAEQHVLKNGLEALEIDSDGYSDAVSGCTIHVDEFDLLVRECLEMAKR